MAACLLLLLLLVASTKANSTNSTVEAEETRDFQGFLIPKDFVRIRCPPNTAKYCPLTLELPFCDVECYCHQNDKLDPAPFPDNKDFPAYAPFTCGPEYFGKHCIRQAACNTNKECDKHCTCTHGIRHYKSEGNKCFKTVEFDVTRVQ